MMKYEFQSVIIYGLFHSSFLLHTLFLRVLRASVLIFLF
jgi:hypothetical protein